MPKAPANPVGGILKSLPMETMFAAPVQAAIKTHTLACKSVAEFIDEVGEDHVADELALDRLTEPADLTPLVILLASGLADHATGSTFDVNAGSYVR